MTHSSADCLFRIVCLLCFSWPQLISHGSAQIYQAEEMNTEQIRVLDRAKTVVLLPGAILEHDKASEQKQEEWLRKSGLK
jgi:hypothetical protein